MKTTISARYSPHGLDLTRRVGLVSRCHVKDRLSCTGFIVLCVLIFVNPLISQAQQDPPAPQCCSRIFTAGLELGWVQAVALYSDVADNEIIEHLNRASRNIEGAHRACSAINPAWPRFRQMIGELQGLADRLLINPVRKTRTEISKRIEDLNRGYADSLRYQIVASEKVHMDTCGANYFLLGTQLAWAHYTFQVASQPGLAQKFAKDFRTFGLNRITLAKRTLAQLSQVKPVTGGCVELWRDGFIKATLTNMLNDRNLSNNQLVSMAQRCWEDTLTALDQGIPSLRINSCVRATRTGTRPPANAPPSNTTTQGGGSNGKVRDYTNTSTHFSCKNKQNQEKKCCCFTGFHTYRFAKGWVQKAVARFDTGKGQNCRSKMRFEVHADGKWFNLGTSDVISSRGSNTYAPNDVSVPVGRIIDGFRLGDNCDCCVDSSEIWLR